MQKDSPFYWLFYYHITKMKESGILKEIQSKYSSQGQICPDKSGEALDMNQCFCAFIIAAAGGLLAMVFLGYVIDAVFIFNYIWLIKLILYE